MKIMAVDPGLKGGIAWGNLEGKEVNVVPMPLDKDGEVDPSGLIDLLMNIDDGPSKGNQVWIEVASAMPRDGRGSAFSFGYNTGLVVAAAHAAVMAKYVHHIRPSEWQCDILATIDHNRARQIAKAQYPNYRCPENKVRQVALCCELFPEVSLIPRGKRHPQDGLADAVMIYEFARRRILAEHKEQRQVQQQAAKEQAKQQVKQQVKQQTKRGAA